MTAVPLGMGITDGNIFFCRSSSEQSRDKKISMRDYNDRTVYDCFDNPFPFYCGSPYLNLPLMPTDDSSKPSKRA